MKHFGFNSVAAIALILLFVVAYQLYLGNWKREDRIIASDVIHYYAYLPALVVHGDLSLKFVEEKPSAYLKKFWPVPVGNGNYVIMTSMGMSIMYAPFFLIAHAYESVLGGNPDGFGSSYRFMLIVGGMFYLLLAMVFLRKSLLHFYADRVVAWTLLIIGLGTNLFNYSTLETSMSHAYSFFLFSMFLYFVHKWYLQPRMKHALLLGLFAGMIALVRPTNAVVGLVFLFWPHPQGFSLLQKVKWMLSQYQHLLWMILAAMLVWLPQLIYWKYYTGSFFYLGYGNDAKFYFFNPQLFNNLFSYRKGWLVYTPLMVFAFVGLVMMWRKRNRFTLPLTAFTLLNVYIISSWWSWWYGGSFGLRAYIESYAVYSFAFAFFIAGVYSIRKWFVRIPIFMLIAILIAYNLFQTLQYNNGAIHYVGMTKAAYWDSFLRIKPSSAFYDLITIPDMELARQGVYKYEPINKPQPAETPKPLEEKALMEYFEKVIRNSENWMKIIEKKAQEWDMPVDSVLMKDVRWLYKKEMEKTDQEEEIKE